MKYTYRVLTLVLLLCASGCIRDHAVAVTNNTDDILYDVTYSDCYWSVLKAGETSEVCIPSAREDHVRFFLIEGSADEDVTPGMPNNMAAPMNNANATNMTAMATSNNMTSANNTSANNSTSSNNMTGGMGMTDGMGGMGMGMGMGGMGGMGMRPPSNPRYRTTTSFTLGEDEAVAFGVEADAYEEDPDYNPRPAPI